MGSRPASFSRHQPYRVFRLGPGQFQRTVRIADVLFAHGDCPLLNIKVIPSQSYQFSLPQTADQLQVEHGEQSSGLRRVQIGLHMLWGTDFHLQLPGLGYDAVLAGIAGDEPLLYRTIQCAVEHQVDAVNGGGA